MATEMICDTVEALTAKLQADAARHRIFYHYTNVTGLIGILRSGYLHLSSLRCMNDKTEVFYGDDQHRDNTFAFSFSTGTKENMALWGLYSIPWIEGVRLDISNALLEKMLRSPHALYHLPTETAPDYVPFSPDTARDLTLFDVVYCNEEGHMKSRDFKISESLVVQDHPHLIGYVKKDAWSYENETRIRICFDNAERLSAIALKLPEAFQSDVRITVAPWFQGDLAATLQQTFGKRFTVRKSAFTDLVTYRDHCFYCAKKPFAREAPVQLTEPAELVELT